MAPSARAWSIFANFTQKPACSPMTRASPQIGTVTMIDNATGKKFEFPVIDGTVGPRVVDIRKFYAKTGMFTYDPGFTSDRNRHDDRQRHRQEIRISGDRWHRRPARGRYSQILRKNRHVHL